MDYNLGHAPLGQGVVKGQLSGQCVDGNYIGSGFTHVYLRSLEVSK